MKKIFLIIAALLILTIFLIKTPSGDLEIRIQNTTDKDIFRVWLGRAKLPSNYFFRKDRTTVFENIKKNKTTDYEKVFNTRAGLSRLDITTDEKGNVKKRYRFIGGLLDDLAANSNAKKGEQILENGKYTLKITGFIDGSNVQNSVRYRLIKDD